MRRRDFIAFLGAATLTRPLAAAPQSSKVYRVGLVLAVTPVADMAGPEPVDPVTSAFLHALGTFNYVEGQNLILERRSAEGQFSRYDDIIAELVRLKTDVIVTSSFPTVQQARSALNTVPIVTVFNRDPVEGGLANSLARPAGNITGFTLLAPETDGKRIELLKETLPGATRVAYLGTNKDWEGPSGQSVRAVAQVVGLTVILAEHTPTEYTGAFTLLDHVHVDALFVSSTYQFVNRNLIVDFARQRRLPDTHNNREAVERGALMSYGPDIRDIYRRFAAYVDKILKGARSPAIYRSSSRPNLTWSSTSTPRRRSASQYLLRFSPAPTR